MARASLLVVEDESIVALELAGILADRGHEVCGIATTEAEALRLAEACAPDLALVDVRLAEGGSGLALSETLRDRHYIPSVLVSAHVDEAGAVRARALGYVRKPFVDTQIAELVDAALAWLREAQVEDPPPGLIATRRPKASGDGRPPGPVTVLLIDDERLLRSTVALQLRKAGYEVTTADGGAQAVALYRQRGGYDVVILDVVMPEQDGLETMRDLQRFDPAVRVLAISGYGAGGPLDYLRIARAFGAQGTLRKPFTAEALNAALAELIDGTGSAAAFDA